MIKIWKRIKKIINRRKSKNVGFKLVIVWEYEIDIDESIDVKNKNFPYSGFTVFGNSNNSKVHSLTRRESKEMINEFFLQIDRLRNIIANIIGNFQNLMILIFYPESKKNSINGSIKFLFLINSSVKDLKLVKEFRN